MVYTRYAKQRILHLYFKEKLRAPTIAKALLEEGIQTSRRGVAKFLMRYKSTGTILRRPGSGRRSKITQQVKELVEAQMHLDDETTASQLHKLLISKKYIMSFRTILRCRKELGWTFRGSSYCQLIRTVNKVMLHIIETVEI